VQFFIYIYIYFFFFLLIVEHNRDVSPENYNTNSCAVFWPFEKEGSFKNVWDTEVVNNVLSLVSGKIKLTPPPPTWLFLLVWLTHKFCSRCQCWSIRLLFGHILWHVVCDTCHRCCIVASFSSYVLWWMMVTESIWWQHDGCHSFFRG